MVTIIRSSYSASKLDIIFIFKKQVKDMLGETNYLEESKVLQYFDNVRNNLVASNAFAKVVNVSNFSGL